MAGNQQYQVQLEALKELESYLHRVDSDLQQIMRRYSQTVVDLVDRGLTMEDHDRVLKEFYLPSQSLVNQSCSIIVDQAIPFVRRQISGLEQQMM